MTLDVPSPSQPVDLASATVDVCVCTYRRASLEQTLRSIRAQRGLKAQRLRVIVADNDNVASAEALAVRMAQTLGLSLRYLHAPARNISIARNACLEAVEAPLFAFIDDDEVATPDWLAELLEAQVRSGADVVFGPVRAIYSEAAPAWMRRADLHSIQPFFRRGVIEGGYSCNVLVRREAVGELRFDPSLGRSGGEDTWFFHQMSMAGARLVFSPTAHATEAVNAPRAHLRWLMRRSFRAGQTHARILLTKPLGRARLAGLALMKAIYCLGSAGLSAPFASRRNRALVRGALHIGVLSKLAGRRDLTLY